MAFRLRFEAGFSVYGLRSREQFALGISEFRDSRMVAESRFKLLGVEAGLRYFKYFLGTAEA